MSPASLDRTAESTQLDTNSHTALRQFGQELPDACERLSYVRQMTEQAANKVLTLVEAAQDDAEKVRRQGHDLSEALMRLATSPDLGVERARSMMRLCAAYAATAADFAAREKSLHTELMMSQDFQDLSGQVINKVIGMLQRSAEPLAHVLSGVTPAPATAAPGGAPSQAQVQSQTQAQAQPSAALEGVQTPDKALQQEDVDDLLASLGF